MLYGFSDSIGPLSYPVDEQSTSLDKPFAEETARKMDEEAQKLVDQAYIRTSMSLEYLTDSSSRKCTDVDVVF